MRKGRRILLVVTGAIAMGWVAWSVLRPSAPIYAGKPVHYWIEILDSISPGQDPPPEWQELGPDEFAVLMKALEFRDSRFHNGYPAIHQRIWQKLPVSILRRLPRPMDTETIAINALMLLYVMGDPDRKYPVDTRPAIPVLIRLVKADKSSAVRHMAASELGLIGVKDQEVTMTLIGALDDKSEAVRNNAAEALKRLDPESAHRAGVPTRR